MCGHAARQVRAVVTCRRYQYGNKGSLVRSLGETWAPLLLSHLGSGGVANWEAALRRTWRGKRDGVALSPSDSALCFLEQGGY